VGALDTQQQKNQAAEGKEVPPIGDARSRQDLSRDRRAVCPRRGPRLGRNRHP
jgi:hypothetical protein